MDTKTIGILAGSLAVSYGLVEVVKALISRLNGKKNGNGSDSRKLEKLVEDQIECKGALLAVHQQVKDRDGVPLSFHMRELMTVSRAMLSRMESMAETQNETAHLQESSAAILERLEKRVP